MKNEYYSNNKVLKRTSKNNIIPHIWVFFCKFWKIFILLLPYFTIFLYFHLFISKHFETYLCTIRIIFVFVFVFVVILKTNIIRIRIRLILKSEYYSYSYLFDFEKRILFVFVFGLKLLFVSSLIKRSDLFNYIPRHSNTWNLMLVISICWPKVPLCNAIQCLMQTTLFVCILKAIWMQLQSHNINFYPYKEVIKWKWADY